MTTLCYLLLLMSAYGAVSAIGWESQEIDWEKEVFDNNKLFQSEYNDHEMDKLVKDIYTAGFVYISPSSIIQGDIKDLAEYEAARSLDGHWEVGTEHIFSTCGNTAVIWANFFFIDVKNITQRGYISLLFEHADDRSKVKLVQFTV